MVELISKKILGIILGLNPLVPNWVRIYPQIVYVCICVYKIILWASLAECIDMIMLTSHFASISRIWKRIVAYGITRFYIYIYI